MLELLVSLAVVSGLLAILLPALSSARMSSYRALCAGNQRLVGQAWVAFLEGNEGRFPTLFVQPGWLYGGVRFSSTDERPFLDYDRPLNRYLPVHHLDVAGEHVFRCPADHGITDEHREIGTGRRTAYRAFGTSFRANARLVGRRDPAAGGLRRDQITTAPSRLVVMGDAVWYESLENTGRLAVWHGTPNAGNLLFLDGSVRFVVVEPRPAVGPAVFDPVSPDLVFPLGEGKRH
jgi:prepilin-type processing-associated H-X9-DG protein